MSSKNTSARPSSHSDCPVQVIPTPVAVITQSAGQPSNQSNIGIDTRTAPQGQMRCGSTLAIQRMQQRSRDPTVTELRLVVKLIQLSDRFSQSQRH
ncbi:hypothetical protein M407DRAFT_17653 [Tulasnella calospora MUT 4182]|uniref:Uncharacterized protein n=1 Tax=Tulasnella calospora MUT 4182 TaxID=1051891 RepID=A0A0C3QV49_9AGAM|nr:hypothetical protein M407DRAFT_17653 [Tulasnella calospora MUT 4182]